MKTNFSFKKSMGLLGWLIVCLWLGGCQTAAGPSVEPTGEGASRLPVEISLDAEPVPDNTPAADKDSSADPPTEGLTAAAPSGAESVELNPASATSEPSTELGCTLSVSCAVLLDHLSELKPEKRELVPEDGMILPAQVVRLEQGDTAFDVLQRELKAQHIHFEFTRTPAYDATYIEGIHNLYEFDAGDLSGWTYKVNGDFPGYALSRHALAPGDVLEIVYTCDMGRDLGALSGFEEEAA